MRHATSAQLPLSILFGAGAIGLGYLISLHDRDLAAVQRLAALTSATLLVTTLPFLMLKLRDATARNLSGVAFLNMVMTWLAIFFSTLIGVRVGANATLGDTFFVLAGLLLLARYVHDRTWTVLFPGWLALSALILSVSVFLSSFWSTDPAGDVVAGSRFVITLSLVPVLLAGSIHRERAIRVAAGLFVLSAVVNASVGFLDFFGVSSFGSAVTGLPAGLNRSSGLTLHPNHLGKVCAMAIPIGIVLASTASTPLRKLLHVGAIGVLGLGILVSGSRAAILASVLGVAALFALIPAMRRYAFLSFLVGGAIVVGVLLRAPEEAALDVGLERLVQGGSTVDQSNAFRLAQYGEAAADFYSRPLTGHGFGLVREAHNIYLQLLQAGGLLALSGFVVFSTVIIRIGVRLTRDWSAAATSRVLAAGLLASALGWLIGGLVDTPLYDRYLYVPAGLILALHGLRGNVKGPTPRARPSLSGAS